MKPNKSRTRTTTQEKNKYITYTSLSVVYNPSVRASIADHRDNLFPCMATTNIKNCFQLISRNSEKKILAMLGKMVWFIKTVPLVQENLKMPDHLILLILITYFTNFAINKLLVPSKTIFARKNYKKIPF